VAAARSTVYATCQQDLKKSLPVRLSGDYDHRIASLQSRFGETGKAGQKSRFIGVKLCVATV
jgi:hypothetical protein